MDRTAFALSLGFGVLALTAHEAFSQGNCAPRESVIQQLSARWGESRRAIMLARNNRMVEVFAADETGTWTILATLPNGMTCVLESGTAYEPVSRRAGDPA